MQSHLPPLRFAMSTYCRATATKKRGGLSAATSAPQISVGHTIDCLSYAVPVYFHITNPFLVKDMSPDLLPGKPRDRGTEEQTVSDR